MFALYIAQYFGYSADNLMRNSGHLEPQKNIKNITLDQKTK
jgi:hypothetical protein